MKYYLVTGGLSSVPEASNNQRYQLEFQLGGLIEIIGTLHPTHSISIQIISVDLISLTSLRPRSHDAGMT